MGEAEDPFALGQVRAERVRGGDRRGLGNQLQLARGDPVVPGDLGGFCLKGRPAGDESPEGDRPQPVVAHDRGQDDNGGARPRPASEPSCSDRGCREQDRNLGSDVVVVDRALRIDRREQVQRELRHEGDEQQGRQQLPIRRHSRSKVPMGGRGVGWKIEIATDTRAHFARE